MICTTDKNFIYEFFKKEFEPFNLKFEYNGNPFEITVIPKGEPAKEDIPLNFNLLINGTDITEISCTRDGWKSNAIEDQKFIDKIGFYIYKRYEKFNDSQ